MGHILSLAIASSIILIALYLTYKLLMSGLRQPTLNRAVILAIYFISFTAIPIIRSIESTADIASSTSPTIDFDSMSIVSIQQLAEPTSSHSIWDILLSIYILGAITVASINVFSIFKIRKILRNGHKCTINNVDIFVTDDDHVAPFSIFGKIVIPRRDIDDAVMIIAHERIHASRHHSFDLIVSQIATIVLWFNPAAWLMMSELKAAHEFEADAGVIASGVNMNKYQLLLIKKAVGSRFPSPANSLNHSNLKTRITMMINQKPSMARRWRGLALVPAFAAALAVTNLNAVASVLNDATNSALPTLFGNKVSEINYNDKTSSQLFDTVVESITKTESLFDETSTTQFDSTDNVPDDNISEKPVQVVNATYSTMPKFPGGEAAMLQFLADNIVYPESAIKDNIQGRVIVQFIVDTTGKVTNPKVIKGINKELNDEAIRVVSIMPDFTPGTENGNPVAITYNLPVSFKLTDNDTPKNPGTSLTLPSGAAIFIDGKKTTPQELDALDPDKIDSITVLKNDPDYPDGIISIILKD